MHSDILIFNIVLAGSLNPGLWPRLIISDFVHKLLLMQYMLEGALSSNPKRFIVGIGFYLKSFEKNLFKVRS